jgi:hypothetical protein
LAPACAADDHWAIVDRSGPGIFLVDEFDCAAGDEDGEGVVFVEGVFLAVVVAGDGERAVEETEEAREKPVGVVARVVEEVA